MNECEISLVKAPGEGSGAAVKEMADDSQRALEKTASNLEKQLGEIRHSIPEFQPVEIPDVSKTVADAVNETELPKTPELPDLNQIIADTTESVVKQAFESMPVPKDGKSVTIDDLRPLVKEAVSALIPGPVDAEKLAQDLLSKIPVPEPGSGGRDALTVELEPFIDEKKSYPRDIYTTHKGGLWRSHEKTHGMRDWECIVDGVSGTDIRQDSQRTFSTSLEKASGTVEVRFFDIPVTIYRDVFKSGTEYQPGDTVTWGGYIWHCNGKTYDRPDETGSREWTLTVKKGRDLRDKP